MSTPERFAELVQTFFCDYLIKQRDLRPRTVSAYRDTFRLLIELSAAGLRQATRSIDAFQSDRRSVARLSAVP